MILEHFLNFVINCGLMTLANGQHRRPGQSGRPRQSGQARHKLWIEDPGKWTTRATWATQAGGQSGQAGKRCVCSKRPTVTHTGRRAGGQSGHLFPKFKEISQHFPALINFWKFANPKKPQINKDQ